MSIPEHTGGEVPGCAGSHRHRAQPPAACLRLHIHLHLITGPEHGVGYEVDSPRLTAPVPTVTARRANDRVVDRVCFSATPVYIVPKHTLVRVRFGDSMML